ncbi:MAG: 3'-5' exonuclease [Methylophaga sp.]|nr:3'-5' exonuclease [Methylophaga sp.]
MKPILFYDVETTGLPDWKAPSDAEQQPHIVQLACILADADTREEVASMSVIVSADGWLIPEEVTAIHGISTLAAQQLGVGEEIALKMFAGIWKSPSTIRVAHNKTFDQRIMRIGFKRYGLDLFMEDWADKDSHFCTMRMYQQQFGGKSVKLIDAYHDATGEQMEGAHDAMADTRACMTVYWWLLDQQKPKAGSPFDLMETASVS